MGQNRKPQVFIVELEARVYAESGVVSQMYSEKEALKIEVTAYTANAAKEHVERALAALVEKTR